MIVPSGLAADFDAPHDQAPFPPETSAAAAALTRIVPGLPVQTSALYAALALAVSAATGLFAGVAPARHAARLDPLEALRAE
jgi:putative ABC transport system permease protein